MEKVNRQKMLELSLKINFPNLPGQRTWPFALWKALPSWQVWLDVNITRGGTVSEVSFQQSKKCFYNLDGCPEGTELGVGVHLYQQVNGLYFDLADRGVFFNCHPKHGPSQQFGTYIYIYIYVPSS